MRGNARAGGRVPRVRASGCRAEEGEQELRVVRAEGQRSGLLLHGGEDSYAWPQRPAARHGPPRIRGGGAWHAARAPRGAWRRAARGGAEARDRRQENET